MLQYAQCVAMILVERKRHRGLVAAQSRVGKHHIVQRHAVVRHANHGSGQSAQTGHRSFRLGKDDTALGGAHATGARVAVVLGFADKQAVADFVHAAAHPLGLKLQAVVQRVGVVVPHGAHAIVVDANVVLVRNHARHHIDVVLPVIALFELFWLERHPVLLDPNATAGIAVRHVGVPHESAAANGRQRRLAGDFAFGATHGAASWRRG